MKHPRPAASVLATFLLVAAAGAFQPAPGPPGPVAVRDGAFDRFVADTRDAVWPWEEKLGARPIGQWRVIYPDAPSRTKESPDFDEVVTLTRYASREHWLAMRSDRAVLLGGNGRDEEAWRAAVDAQARVTRDTSVELMQGEMYNSPPIFNPALTERYRLSR